MKKKHVVLPLITLVLGIAMFSAAYTDGEDVVVPMDAYDMPPEPYVYRDYAYTPFATIGGLMAIFSFIILFVVIEDLWSKRFKGALPDD